MIPESVTQLFTEDEAAPRVDSEPTEQSAPNQNINPEPQTQLNPSTPRADSNQQETTHMPSPIPSVHTEPDSPKDDDVCNSFAAIGPLLEIQCSNQLSPINHKHSLQPNSPLRLEAAPARGSAHPSPGNTTMADLQDPEVKIVTLKQIFIHIFIGCQHIFHFSGCIC